MTKKKERRLREEEERRRIVKEKEEILKEKFEKRESGEERREGGREYEMEKEGEQWKLEEEKVETARHVLFGTMVLERILEMYVRCYQEEVWDVWDYPDSPTFS